VHHGGCSGCLSRYWLDTVVHHGGEGVYKKMEVVLAR